MWKLVLLAPVWAATVITQSAGLVDKDVVTSREVHLAVIADRVLNQNGAKAPDLEVTLKDLKLAEATSAYLIEKAAALEAQSFSVGVASDLEVKEAISKIEKATGGKGTWAAMEPSPNLVKQIVHSKLTAKNYVKIKSDSMTGIITDGEAQAYFEKNRLKFDNSPFETFKENIKTFLSQQQRQDQLRAWFEVLKKKYKVRNLLLENAKTTQPAAHTQNSAPRS